MKKILRAAAVGILLAALLVFLKNEYGRYLLSHASYGMQALITEQQESSRDAEGVNLFIGSSMFRKGLDIRELEEGMVGDNYILSYNGTRPFQSYEEVLYATEQGVKIRHLYVDLYAYAMLVEPWVEDERLFLETDLPFKIRLWTAMRPYSSNCVKDFWQMFVTANNERLLCWPVDSALTNAQFQRGGTITEDAGYGVGSLQETTFDVPDAEPAAFNEAQESYLRKLIRFCQEKSIPLTFIETPKYKNVMYEEQYVSLMRAYLQLLNDENAAYYIAEDTAVTCQEETQNRTACKGVVSFHTDNPEYYSDVIHLSGAGKTAYTRELVRVLNEKEGG